MSRVEVLLEETLSNWQCWDVELPFKPVVEKKLQGGRTNQSFLVKAGVSHAVVRINAENSQCLGIDRLREAKILSHLQPLWCIPKTLHISERVLVSEYISGRCWRADDLNHQLQREKLSRLLSTIQQLPLPENITRRNYFDYCQNYIDQLPLSHQKKHSEFINRLQRVTKDIDKACWQPVICHHDLVPENIIESEQGLFLLDWEYAAYGHPALDWYRAFGTVPDSFRSDNDNISLLQQGMDLLWNVLQSVQA